MNLTAEHPVTDALREAFRVDGVVCLRALLDKDWVDALRAGTEHALANPGPHSRDLARERGYGGRFFVDVGLWRREPFRSLLSESPIGAAVAALLGSREIRLYNDRLLVKEPGCDAPTLWHQDLPYFHYEGSQAGGLWISLDRSSRDSGALEFVKGSHRWGRLYHAEGLDFERMRGVPGFAGAVPDVEVLRKEFGTVCFELEPGDCTFHHALTLHGAGGNTSVGTRRRAYALRLVGEDVRWMRRGYSPTAAEGGVRDGERLGGGRFPMLVSCRSEVVLGQPAEEVVCE